MRIKNQDKVTQLIDLKSEKSSVYSIYTKPISCLSKRLILFVPCW